MRSWRAVALALALPACASETGPNAEAPTPREAFGQAGAGAQAALTNEPRAHDPLAHEASSASFSALSSAPTPTPSATANTPEAVAPEPIPAALLRVLAVNPYVEVDCEGLPQAGFPEGVTKRCRYTAMGVTAEVVTANPEPEVAARWFLDAARSCAPLEAFRTSDPLNWQRGVVAFAKHMRLQSSRIFPLSGAIVEDLGDGPTAFEFDRGVVAPCAQGKCRCRINSLSSVALCRFREAQGASGEACRKSFESDESWRAQCLLNHQQAFRTGENEHLRARAHLVGEAVAKKCRLKAERSKGKGCVPGEVVMLIEAELGLAKP